MVAVPSRKLCRNNPVHSNAKYILIARFTNEYVTSFSCCRVRRDDITSAVQDPEALSANHDRLLHDELSRAWQEMKVECTPVHVTRGGSQV